MRSQALRIFSRIVLLSEIEISRDVSFSIQGVSKWIHRLPPNYLPPTMMLQSSGSSDAFAELVALNRGGMVALENEQRNNSLV